MCQIQWTYRSQCQSFVHDVYSALLGIVAKCSCDCLLTHGRWYAHHNVNALNKAQAYQSPSWMQPKQKDDPFKVPIVVINGWFEFIHDDEIRWIHLLSTMWRFNFVEHVLQRQEREFQLRIGNFEMQDFDVSWVRSAELPSERNLSRWNCCEGKCLFPMVIVLESFLQNVLIKLWF